MAFAICFLCFALMAYSKATPADWQEQVRGCVAGHDLAGALKIVEARLTEAPQDLEAHGWRARLLGWLGRWQEAEAEYRTVLEAAPHDVDMLVGLSDVLTWQRRYEDALTVLDRAAETEPARADVYLSRGRTHRALGQSKQAHGDFEKALALQLGNSEAEAGLASLSTDPRFTVSFGTDIDTFNFTGMAYAFTTSLAAQINPKWVATVSEIGQERFAQNAQTFLASAGYRLTRHDSITVGGGVANAQAVVPTSNAFFEYGHSFSLDESGFLRAVETTYNQHWYWYQGARVMTLAPRITLDLPGQWNWSLQVTAAQSNFTGLPVGWKPSELTRLNFPVRGALSGNAFFAVGAEDFALADQIGSFSARTYGGGLSYWWHQRHHFSGYIARQDRSQQQTQTSYGVNYAFRF